MQVMFQPWALCKGLYAFFYVPDSPGGPHGQKPRICRAAFDNLAGCLKLKTSIFSS